MTDYEKDEYNYLLDKIKRKNIIEEVLFMAFSNETIPLNKIENIKEFYKKYYGKYLGIHITICSNPFSYGDFCFNDAGFQFKWKNHNRVFQLECIPWDVVKNHLNLLINS